MQTYFSEINYSQHIREGWTVKDVIEDLEDSVSMIMTAQNFKTFKNKTELINWLRNNYNGNVVPNKPKGKLLEVEKHFCLQWGL